MRPLIPFFTAMLSVLFAAGERPISLSDPYQLPKGKNGMISLRADGFFGSDAITNRLATDYLLHRFITDEHKSDVESMMSGTNRFGSWFDGSFDLALRIDSSNLAIIGTVQHHLYYDCLFTEDLFSLYFRGNKPFAGKKAAIGGSSFRSILYYQIGAGVSGRSSSGKLYWHLLGSLYLGHDLLDITSNSQGSLYTATDGSYIDADLDIRFVRSDSLNSSPISVNGLGAGLTFGSTFLIGRSWQVTLAGSNIGFISFNEKTADATIDTTFRFEGIDARELFEFNDSVQVFANDSAYIESYFKERSQRRHTRIVPGHIDLSAKKDFQDGRWTLAFGIRHLNSPNADPLVWAEGRHTIGRHTFGISARNGGYTGLSAGFSYGIQTSGWRMEIGSDVVTSWLNTSMGRSMGAFLSLSKSF